jgi:copper transport protein
MHVLLRALRFLLAAVLGGLCAVSAVVFDPHSALAHNSLSSSEPASGAVLSDAPTQIRWIFATDVPLDTMSVTLIDHLMVRTELMGSHHSTASEREVITPLPQLEDGLVSVRWRLVSPDGHVISGRVDFTVAARSPGELGPSQGTDSLTGNGRDLGSAEPFAPSSFLRWVMRYVSYAAIMTVVGILLASRWVWGGAMDHRVLRGLVSRSLVAIALLALAQLLVLAADLAGVVPWRSAGEIDAAFTLTAGVALALRFVLAVSIWMVIFGQNITSREVYQSAVGLPLVGLLATWAFAGHAASMRWPALGVVVDVIHHGAAAVWCGDWRSSPGSLFRLRDRQWLRSACGGSPTLQQRALERWSSRGSFKACDL